MRLEPRTPGFNPGTSHMRFVVDKAYVVEVSSLRVPRLSSQRHAINDLYFLHSNMTLNLETRYQQSTAISEP